MSDPVNHLMKLIGVVPDGMCSLSVSPDGKLRVLSRGVVVGGQYLVAANTAEHVEAQDGN